jgi:hypothetical protein
MEESGAREETIIAHDLALVDLLEIWNIFYDIEACAHNYECNAARYARLLGGWFTRMSIDSRTMAVRIMQLKAQFVLVTDISTALFAVWKPR